MAKNNDLKAFNFHLVWYGIYTVTYTTNRGDYWVATINDMELIDNTKNADTVKSKDIEILRRAVKRAGIHFNSDGKMID